MNPELKELIAAFDAGVAHLCKIIDRAEARFASMEAAAVAPADPLADHPELPLAAEDEAEIRWAPVDADGLHPVPGVNCDIANNPIQ
jgi:hypothetical protein